MKTKEVYQTVTDRIIESLNKGNIPWKKQWSVGAAFGAHVNLISRKPYRGVNQLLTTCAAIDQGYRLTNWATFKQWNEIGAQVKRGEKSCPIVYFTKLEIENDKPKNENDLTKEIPFIKMSSVFNLDQVEGADSLRTIEQKSTEKPFNRVEACEQIIDGFFKNDGKITLKHQGGRACYLPMRDLILMPEREAFTTESDYYAVLFHEMTHSTGAESRLSRDGVTKFDKFGSHQYSKEELIAEMGAAFLCSIARIDNDTLNDNHAAYLQSWMRVLKNNDPKFIFEAAAQAQKASDLILNQNVNVERKVG